MKNSNDNLKEKAIRANELENVSGGRRESFRFYQVDWNLCQGNCERDCMEHGCESLVWDNGQGKPQVDVTTCSTCGWCACCCPCNAIYR